VIALVVTVPAAEAELAADALWALGVVAIEERDPAGGAAVRGTTDTLVELWTSLGDDPEVIGRVAEAFPSRWRWHLAEVDESVAESWRAHVVPTWITPDLVIVPAWLPEAASPPGADATTMVVPIDPGAAFGLGDHPTTVLTLRALRAVQYPDATVLDVGCGSGVLAVVAARAGAPYVEAIDLSPGAVEATLANAERNGVAGRVRASTTPLASIEGPFDVVLANILAPALIELAEDLRRVTAPSGVLVISGVLEHAHDHVLAALAPMQVVDRLTRDGWAAVILRH
jgi:ribosomal protein L11 methyltransferase